MRAKIIMDTIGDAKRIEEITKNLKAQDGFDDRISITDSAGLRVDASSFVGLLHAMEFNELWLEANGDYYTQYKDFIVGNNLEAPAAY